MDEEDIVIFRIDGFTIEECDELFKVVKKMFGDRVQFHDLNDWRRVE